MEASQVREEGGGHPPLKRGIGPVLLLFFVVGDIVGAGIYALVGEVGAVTGGAIWTAFLSAFVLAAFTAASYVELVTKYPRAGGSATYAHNAFRTPFVSFIVAFAVAASSITSACVLTLAFSGDDDVWVFINGLLDKVILVFDKPYWPRDVDKFAHLAEEQDRYPEFLNWHRYGGQPVLFSYCSGTFARAMEKRGDAQVLAEVMEVVRKMFGARTPAPKKSKVVRWAQDPFTFGSYSYLPVGATPEHLDTLAEPFGRVLFAGEATSRDYQATVHGAYLSGLREARRLLAG